MCDAVQTQLAQIQRSAYGGGGEESVAALECRCPQVWRLANDGLTRRQPAVKTRYEHARQQRGTTGGNETLICSPVSRLALDELLTTELSIRLVPLGLIPVHVACRGASLQRSQHTAYHLAGSECWHSAYAKIAHVCVIADQRHTRGGRHRGEAFGRCRELCQAHAIWRSFGLERPGALGHGVSVLAQHPGRGAHIARAPTVGVQDETIFVPRPAQRCQAGIGSNQARARDCLEFTQRVARPDRALARQSGQPPLRAADGKRCALTQVTQTGRCDHLDRSVGGGDLQGGDQGGYALRLHDVWLTLVATAEPAWFVAARRLHLGRPG